MRLLHLLSLVPFLALLPAQQIDPAGVTGTRILGGGGKLPPEIYDIFVERAGNTNARIVIIPTASSRADTEEGRQRSLRSWQEDYEGVHFEILHTRDRAVADSEEFTAPLRKATGVWIGGGAQARLAQAYLGTRVEKELHALLARDGIVGGSSAGTAIQTKVMIEKGMDPPVLATGFDLLPSAIADQHFLKRKRMPRLVKALAIKPGLFGVGIDEGTALIVSKRTIAVLGKSKAVFVLPESGGHPQNVFELTAGQSTDLVSLQRAGRQRAQAPWPPTRPREPNVANGSLVIAGGGAMPLPVMQRFVELAGGTKNARIVIVPAAVAKAARRKSPVERMLRSLGITEIQTIDASHPREVTKADVATIDKATAIWFTGGRQWRIVDAFEGTDVPAAFHRVLERGGVIAGSSAGATIQGEFLVRGNPLGNRTMWWEGYAHGYGFLPGCAIDQHFIRRNREADMQQLIERFPQVIGLGIDEGTAAVVTGDTLEVVGKSKVAVFDARKNPDKVAPIWLEPRQRWSLVRGLRLQ